jgi:hypothetical protein
MLGSIISHPPGRRKNYNGWIGRKKIKKTKRAEVYIACFVNSGGKTNWTWSNDMLQVVLFLSTANIFEVKNHNII